MNGAEVLDAPIRGGELNHAAPRVAAGLPVLISPAGLTMLDLILPIVLAACSVPPDTAVASQPRSGSITPVVSPTMICEMNTPAIRMVFPDPTGLVSVR